MADFHTSTHRSRWMFKPQDLVAKREASNRRAVQTLHRCGTTRLDVDIDGSLSYPESQVHEGGNMKSIPDPLSVEEEQMIRIFYERKIQEVCGAFGFPHKIQATAIMYFKRFYLLWSVMEHDPKHIMLTCIYTSCKVEEFHVSAEELGRGIQQDHQVILNNEMIVLQSLGFDLIVYTPYRSIDGFIDDMEDFFKVNNVQAARYQDLRNAAIVETDKAMLTDAPLLFPPGQQALAILLGLNEEYKVMDFQRYLEGICLRGRHNDSYELNALLSDINTLVKEAKTSAAKDMRHIDRKLKYCWNPSLLDENKKKDKKKHKPKRTSSEILDAPAL